MSARALTAARLVGVLLAPGPASAHVRSGIVATDYRATVDSSPPPASSALAVRLLESDLAVELTRQTGRSVVVLGYSGEPFLRLDSTGVAVNEASPTGVAVGLVDERREVRGPAWVRDADGATYAWHDDRLGGLPSGVERGRWSMPLVVDGEPAALEGGIERVDAPPLWPWLAVGGAVAVLTALLLLVRRPARTRAAAVVLGVTTAAATIAVEVGFGVDPNASAGTWVETGNAIAFALAGLAAIAFGSRDVRAVACGLLGLLGLFAGVLWLEVLSSGIVFSALPNAAARLGVVLAISAGASAMVAAALSLGSERRAD